MELFGVADDVALKSMPVLLVVAGALAYGRGWWRLHALGHAPPRWRATSYALGLAATLVAVLGLDQLADERFAVHMVQHLVLIMVGAPLVMLGNPLAFVLWGLPRGARRFLGATLRRGARVRTALALLTWAPVAGPLYVVTVWGWHVPRLYDAAVEHELLHALEHVLFFATAILFWWPIIAPAPTLRPRLHPGLQIFYLLLATAQNTALGMALTLPERAFYPHYVQAAAALGMSAAEDQALGGGLMWMMGHMFLLPILVILYRLSRASAQAAERAAA